MVVPIKWARVGGDSSLTQDVLRKGSKTRWAVQGRPGAMNRPWAGEGESLGQRRRQEMAFSDRNGTEIQENLFGTGKHFTKLLFLSVRPQLVEDK